MFKFNRYVRVLLFHSRRDELLNLCRILTGVRDGTNISLLHAAARSTLIRDPDSHRLLRELPASAFPKYVSSLPADRIERIFFK